MYRFIKARKRCYVPWLDRLPIYFTDYGNSYANVFTIPVGNKKYIGVETFSSVDTTYLLQMYMLNPDTDELQPKVKIKKTVNEDGREENVWQTIKHIIHIRWVRIADCYESDNYKDSVCGGKSGFDRKQYSGCIRCVI